MTEQNPLATHKFYPGPNNREMPNLVFRDGRNPISPSQREWRKLETLNNYLSALRREDKEGIQAWENEMVKYWDQYIDTGFGVARHPDQGVILVPNAEHLRNLNLNTPLSANDRYIALEDGTFETLKGVGHHYHEKDVSKYGNCWLPQEEAQKNPFWGDFVPDENLREAAIHVTYNQFKERFHQAYEKNKNLMGVFLPRADDQEVMGLYGFGGLEHMSDAYDWGLLGSPVGRLVGVLPSVAEGDVQNLEDLLIKFPSLRKQAA